MLLRFAFTKKHKNVVMILKTLEVERLKQNLNISDFELTVDEMQKIKEIPYCGGWE